MLVFLFRQSFLNQNHFKPSPFSVLKLFATAKPLTYRCSNCRDVIGFQGKYDFIQGLNAFFGIKKDFMMLASNIICHLIVKKNPCFLKSYF